MQDDEQDDIGATIEIDDGGDDDVVTGEHKRDPTVTITDNDPSDPLRNPAFGSNVSMFYGGGGGGGGKKSDQGDDEEEPCGDKSWSAKTRHDDDVGDDAQDPTHIDIIPDSAIVDSYCGHDGDEEEGSGHIRGTKKVLYTMPPEPLAKDMDDFIASATGIRAPGTDIPLEELLSMIRRPQAAANGITPDMPMLELQITGIDYKAGIPDSSIPTFLLSGVSGATATAAKVPIVYITGTTASGVDVLVRCHNIRPFLYVDIPKGAYDANIDDIPKWLAAVKGELNQQAWALELSNRRNTGKGRVDTMGANATAEDSADIREGPIVTGVDIHWDMPLVPEYTEDGMTKHRDYVKIPFFRVSVRLPRFVPLIRHIAEYEGGVVTMWPADDLPTTTVHLNTYESNVPFALRSAIHLKTCGHSWIRLNTSSESGDGNTIRSTTRDWFAPKMLIRDLAEADGETWSAVCRDTLEKVRMDRVAEEKKAAPANYAWAAMQLGDDDGGGEDEVQPNLFTNATDINDMFKRYDKKTWSEPGRPGESRAQVEIDIHWVDIESVPTATTHPNHAKFREFSFDIECSPLREGAFPVAGVDPVVTICTRYILDNATADALIANTSLKATESEKAFGVAFQLGACTGVPGMPTYHFRSQRDMLMMFSYLIRAIRPDIITGYNVHNFDFPYLVKTAYTQGIGNRFVDCSLIPGWPLRVIKSTFRSRGTGTRENNTIQLAGAVVCDTMLLAQNSLKTSSYSLAAVARLVGSAKIEHTPSQVRDSFFIGTPEDRGETAIYCAQDALLAFTILQFYKWIPNVVEMTRAAQVGPSDIFTRGQQVRVYSWLLRVCQGRAIVNTPSQFDDRFPPSTKYKGARVFEPQTGNYGDVPVGTLDFESLYPSIMITGNIDYTTLIPEAFIHLFDVSDISTAPNGARFLRAPPMFTKSRLEGLGLKRDRDFSVVQGDFNVLRNGAIVEKSVAVKLGLRPNLDYRPAGPDQSPSVVELYTKRRIGFVPIISINLKLLRGVAKKELANATTDEDKMIFNAKQNSLKLVGNSTYGFTAGNTLSIRILAHATTSYGQTWISLSQEILENFYSKENGYGFRASVRYGDTDSVMVLYGLRVPHGPSIIDIVKTTMPDILHTLSIAGREALAMDQETILKIKTRADLAKYLRERSTKCAKSLVKTRKCTCLPPFAVPFLGNTQHPVVDNAKLPALVPVGDHVEEDKANKSALVANVGQAIEHFYQCTTGQVPHSNPENVQLAVDESMAYASACVAVALRDMYLRDLPDHEIEMFINVYLNKNKAHPEYQRFADIATKATSAKPLLVVYDATTQAIRMNIVQLLVEQVAVFCRESSKLIGSLLPGQLNLAFEKVMVRFGLMGKKMYHAIRFLEGKKGMYNAGAYWTGMATVRRDHSDIVRNTISTAGDLVMKQGDVRNAIAVVHDTIFRLNNNLVPLNELVITKAYSRQLSRLDTLQPHIHVARMIAMRSGNILQPGCRIPYVMTRVLTKRKAEKAEDPFYAATHNCDIDADVYIQELHSSLEGLLGAVVKDYDRIFALTASPEELVPLHDVPQTTFKNARTTVPDPMAVIPIQQQSVRSVARAPQRQAMLTTLFSSVIPGNVLGDMFRNADASVQKPTQPKVFSMFLTKEQREEIMAVQPASKGKKKPSTRAKSQKTKTAGPLDRYDVVHKTTTAPVEEDEETRIKRIFAALEPREPSHLHENRVPRPRTNAPPVGVQPANKIRKEGLSIPDTEYTIGKYAQVVGVQCRGCHGCTVAASDVLCDECVLLEVEPVPGVPKPSAQLTKDIEDCQKSLDAYNQHCSVCMRTTGINLKCANTECPVTYMILNVTKRLEKATGIMKTLQSQVQRAPPSVTDANI